MMQRSGSVYFLPLSVALVTLLAGCASNRTVELPAKAGYGGGAQIGVLLPTSDNPKYNIAVAEIRQGIEAAEKRDPDITSVYMQNTETGVAAAYAEFAENNMSVIIGPLLPKNVDILAKDRPKIPTLFLNRVSGQSDDAVHSQFALFPEDEARSAAIYLDVAGFEKSIVVYPERSIVGEKLARKFKPGRKDSWVTYDEGGDFKPDLRGRKDIDAAFLVAEAEDTKAIYEKLKRQLGVPVIATSHTVAGPSGDFRGLEGLYIVVIPWFLYEEVRAGFLGTSQGTEPQERPLERSKFFAVGIDAYHIAAKLLPNASRKDPIKGATGEIRIDTEGRVSRRLGLGQFVEDPNMKGVNRVVLQPVRFVTREGESQESPPTRDSKGTGGKDDPH